MEFLILIYLLGYVHSFTNAEALKYECPEPEDIFPCYCEEEDEDPIVFCNHLTTPDEVYKGMKGLAGHRIYKVSFFMNWILDPIKTDAFKDLGIERIYFENSTIRLEAPQFQGLDNHLNTISLRACFNRTNPIISLELEHLTKLREVIFEKNRITKLPNDWLKSTPDSLRSIVVEENTIISMEDEVFAKIKHLTFAVLESNRIVMVKRSMFPRPANDLRSLNLNNNRIRFLPDDIFSDMPYLRHLQMAGNRLTTLEESIWSGIISKLTKMDILNNPLECNSILKWMYNNRKLPDVLEGRCQEPERLREKSLSLLKLEDLN